MPPFERSTCFNVTNTVSFDAFQYFNKLSEKRKHFSKNWSATFEVKLLRLKTQQYHTKLLSEANFKTGWGGEWGVKNRTITKNGVLPVTTLFFQKFYFSWRTSYRELIWCTNHSNAHIHTFWKRWSFIRGCFFPCEYP